MENETENKESTSAFLWKAASSTAAVHPLVTAKLLLKCKKELNASNVGVKFKHVSKANICQSCGNPWSLGDYCFEVKKTFKTNKIRKIIKKKAKREKEHKKLSTIEQHMVNRYNTRKCSLLIKCGMCHHSTDFSMPLPRQSEKIHKPNSENIQTNFSKQNSITENEQRKPSAGQTTKEKMNNKQQQNQKQALSKAIKPQGMQQQIAKGQMKSLAAALNKSKKKQSALQSFLSSVK